MLPVVIGIEKVVGPEAEPRKLSDGLMVNVEDALIELDWPVAVTVNVPPGRDWMNP